MAETVFKEGDEVRLRKDIGGHFAFVMGYLRQGQVYTVGAVALLSTPHKPYVLYTICSAYPELRVLVGKSCLETAKHSQRIFLDGVLLSPDDMSPDDIIDPESKGRVGFSGWWFELANG